MHCNPRLLTTLIEAVLLLVRRQLLVVLVIPWALKVTHGPLFIGLVSHFQIRAVEGLPTTAVAALQLMVSIVSAFT